jgi:hypothetical protein
MLRFSSFVFEVTAIVMPAVTAVQFSIFSIFNSARTGKLEVRTRRKFMPAKTKSALKNQADPAVQRRFSIHQAAAEILANFDVLYTTVMTKPQPTRRGKSSPYRHKPQMKSPVSLARYRAQVYRPCCCFD